LHPHKHPKALLAPPKAPLRVPPGGETLHPHQKTPVEEVSGFHTHVEPQANDAIQNYFEWIEITHDYLFFTYDNCQLKVVPKKGADGKSIELDRTEFKSDDNTYAIKL
jgi:hypothetical protein